MKTGRIVVLLITHGLALAAGFAGGIYALPILIAPPPPTEQEVAAAASKATYRGTFRRDLKDSDALHWGEGSVAIATDSVSFQGKLAPGPDYKLYLSPEFVETEADFHRAKAGMVRLGDVKTFENFVVAVPPMVDVSNYSAVIVWCETFGQFITAAKYK